MLDDMPVAATLAAIRSPFLLDRPPASAGRVMLSVGFEHYCLLHWGLGGDEIAEAFGGRSDANAREQVHGSAALLGGALNRGLVRSWARPIGGGDLVELKASAWELDDFARRFSSSAVDPRRPFDSDAPATHWIFVDLDGWNDLVEASVGGAPARAPRGFAPSPHGSVSDDSASTPAADRAEDRIVRLPDVERRTGMSRSTIYRKMRAGRFPTNIPLGDNMIGWRESDVDDWVAAPR